MKDVILKDYNKEIDDQIQDLLKKKALASIKYEFLKLIERKLDNEIESYRGSYIYPTSKGLTLSVIFKAKLPNGYKDAENSVLGGILKDKTKEKLQSDLKDEIRDVLKTVGKNGTWFGHGKLVDYTMKHYPYDPYEGWSGDTMTPEEIKKKKYSIPDQEIRNATLQKGDWYHPVYFSTDQMWFPNGQNGCLSFEDFLKQNSELMK